MGFSRQEYWSGLLCSSPGDVPNPGIKPRSPSLQADSLKSEPPGKPKNIGGVAYPFSRGTSQSRNWTEVSCIAGGFFTSWVTQEALEAQILFFLLWSPIPFPSSPYFSSLDSVLVSLPLHNILTWASFSFVDLEGCWFLPEELPSLKRMPRSKQKLGTEKKSVFVLEMEGQSHFPFFIKKCAPGIGSRKPSINACWNELSPWESV